MNQEPIEKFKEAIRKAAIYTEQYLDGDKEEVVTIGMREIEAILQEERKKVKWDIINGIDTGEPYIVLNNPCEQCGYNNH